LILRQVLSSCVGHPQRYSPWRSPRLILDGGTLCGPVTAAAGRSG
jgi:hypothetical protein